MGRRPEFIDAKFVAQGESREGETVVSCFSMIALIWGMEN